MSVCIRPYINFGPGKSGASYILMEPSPKTPAVQSFVPPSTKDWAASPTDAARAPLGTRWRGGGGPARVPSAVGLDPPG